MEFSKGHFFLDELKKEGEQSNTLVGDKVEFSYNLGPDLKIDVAAAK